MKTQETDQVRTVVDQQLALQTYLDALLRPVIEATETASEPEPVPTRVEMAPEPVPVPPAEQPASVQEGIGEQAAAPVVPEWGERPFQCLLFKVAGLTLAVPLVKLNGVLAWSNDITPMPGHAPWFLGLVRHQGQSVKVIDTALLVLPESRRCRILPPAQERLRNMILIDGGRWGLACESVSEVVTLAPGDVRWRTSRSMRPWLAGTVIERMCALLDTEAFAHMLATGER